MIYQSLGDPKGYVIIPDYPENMDYNDPNNLKYLTKEEQEILLNWCRKLGKTKTMNLKHTSYGLKHIFAKSKNGFYISNGTFKGAMLKLGFRHENVQSNGINWFFNYSQRDLNALIKEE